MRLPLFYSFAYLPYGVEHVSASFSHSIPVLCLHTPLGEEFAAYTHAERSCLEPCAQVVLFGYHTACDHDT